MLVEEICSRKGQQVVSLNDEHTYQILVIKLTTWFTKETSGTGVLGIPSLVRDFSN